MSDVENKFPRVIGFAIALLLVAVAVLSLLPSGHVRAQTSGTMGVYTRTVQVFNGQNSSATSLVLPDFGFAASQLYYCTTNFIGSIAFEWSPSGPGGTLRALPQASASYSVNAIDTACHTLQLGGYWPNLYAVATVSGGSISAWYTASAAPIPPYSAAVGSNGPISPIQCDQNIVVAAANAATVELFGPINSGDTVFICSVLVSFTSAPTSGNIKVGWETSANCNGTLTPTAYLYTPSGVANPLAIPFLERSSYSATYPYACFTNNSGVTVEVTLSAASVNGI
jgi:hypothetical protein